MKRALLFFVSMYFFCSCSIFKGKQKYGCPTDGRNIGAERILSGDKEAIKAAKKAKKFKYQ